MKIDRLQTCLDRNIEAHLIVMADERMPLSDGTIFNDQQTRFEPTIAPTLDFVNTLMQIVKVMGLFKKNQINFEEICSDLGGIDEFFADKNINAKTLCENAENIVINYCKEVFSFVQGSKENPKERGFA